MKDKDKVLAVYPNARRSGYSKEILADAYGEHLGKDWADAASKLPVSSPLPSEGGAMEARRTEPINIPCPRCQAKAGQKCFEDQFGVYQHTFHNARIDAAKSSIVVEHPRADCEGCGDLSCPCNRDESHGHVLETRCHTDINGAGVHREYWEECINCHEIFGEGDLITPCPKTLPKEKVNEDNTDVRLVRPVDRSILGSEEADALPVSGTDAGNQDSTLTSPSPAPSQALDEAPTKEAIRKEFEGAITEIGANMTLAAKDDYNKGWNDASRNAIKFIRAYIAGKGLFQL